MSRQNFNWLPDVGSQLSIKPSAKVTKFGDGYEVRTSYFINTAPENWSVKFTRGNSEIAAIDSFLTDKQAVQAFNWTTPRNKSAVFVCREWSINRIGPMVSELSAKFEQVFES